MSHLHLKAQQISIKKGLNILFQNLNLTFLPGQITVLVGENGAGKSSLLECLAGVYSPFYGNVVLGKNDLKNLSPIKRAQLISSIGQNDDLPGDLTVACRIAQGLLPRLGFNALINDDVSLKIKSISEELKISHLVNRYLNTLSGGEKKRVHIARGLIEDNAKVYILDEPEAGLDLRHRYALIDILKRRSALGKIVIVSLHDLSLAQKLADRVLIVVNGTFAEDGPVHTTLIPEKITQYFIQEMI